jgi:hypothetical protein
MISPMHPFGVPERLPALHWPTPLGASRSVPRLDTLRDEPFTAVVRRRDLSRATAGQPLSGAVELDTHLLSIWRTVPARDTVLDQMLLEYPDVDGFLFTRASGASLVRLVLRDDTIERRVRVVSQLQFADDPSVRHLPRSVAHDPAHAERRLIISDALKTRYGEAATATELDSLARSYAKPRDTPPATLYRALEEIRAICSPRRLARRSSTALGAYDDNYRHGDPTSQRGAYWGSGWDRVDVA